MPDCGGKGQPPCKPVPTTAAPNYTPEEMDAYGWACFLKDRKSGLTQEPPKGDDGGK